MISAMLSAGYGGPLAVPLHFKRAVDTTLSILKGPEARPTRMTEMLPLAARLLGIDPEDEVEAMLNSS